MVWQADANHTATTTKMSSSELCGPPSRGRLVGGRGGSEDRRGSLTTVGSTKSGGDPPSRWVMNTVTASRPTRTVVGLEAVDLRAVGVAVPDVRVGLGEREPTHTHARAHTHTDTHTHTCGGHSLNGEVTTHRDSHHP